MISEMVLETSVYCSSTEPFAFSPAQGLPLCWHDRFVFPFTVPCVRLPSVDWLFWGKWKSRVFSPRFPYGFWFSCPGLVFLVSSHQLLGYLAGRARNRRLHLQLFSPRRLRRRPGYVFEVKVWFQSLYFQIEVSVMFGVFPQRLPSFCLRGGWYEFTSPWVELLCFRYTSRSDVFGYSIAFCRVCILRTIIVMFGRLLCNCNTVFFSDRLWVWVFVL